MRLCAGLHVWYGKLIHSYLNVSLTCPHGSLFLILSSACRTLMAGAFFPRVLAIKKSHDTESMLTQHGQGATSLEDQVWKRDIISMLISTFVVSCFWAARNGSNFSLYRIILLLGDCSMVLVKEWTKISNKYLQRGVGNRSQRCLGLHDCKMIVKHEAFFLYPSGSAGGTKRRENNNRNVSCRLIYKYVMITRTVAKKIMSLHKCAS